MAMKKQEKRYLARVKPTFLCIGVACVLLCATMPEAPSYAERRVKPELVLPKDYPDGFHGYGRLDRMNEREVVIDDHLRKLSPYVTFHTPTEKISGSYAFEPGDLVGYLKDAENQVVSLWLIEKVSP